MAISSSIKGLQSIKSMQNIVKSGTPNKKESDFIKMYLFEKERVRLNSEKIRILQRLEIIQNRLNEIEVYHNEKAGQMHLSVKQGAYQKKTEGVRPDFKTISIDY